MSEPALARVKTGVNKKTFAPLYYVEVRQTPRTRWCLLTSNGKLVVKRSIKSAEKEAREMERRLRHRGQLQ